MEKNKAQEAEIQKQKEEIERRRAEEEKMKKEMEEYMEEKVALEEQYKSIEEEADIKTKKLKKLWDKLKLANSEIKDLQAEFQREREDYLFTIRQLEKDIKLKEKILTGYIPDDYLARIEQKAVWDEETEELTIPNLNLAGASMEPQRLNSAKLQTQQNSRYKSSTVDSPQEFEVYADEMHSFVAVNDSISNVFYSYGVPVQKDLQTSKKRVGSAAARPKTAGRKVSTSQENLYPQAKGLGKNRRN